MSGKAGNLRILMQNGISVPRGFSIPSAHYTTAVQSLRSRILEALPDASAVEAIFDQCPLPTITSKLLAREMSSLKEVKYFAVRSSGNVEAQGIRIAEDSATVSLAGQFESFLAVPADEVPQAILRCWASLFNDRSIDRFNVDVGYVSGSSMTVLVQEMVQAKSSAVMMTLDPQGNGEIGAIEGSWGPCEALVSGMVSPDEIIFNRRTGSISSKSCGKKEVRASYEPFSGSRSNITRVPLNKMESGTISISDEKIDEIIILGSQVERIFGRPQDIELVIDHCDKIVVTQTRAITVLPAIYSPFL